jgi:hypothetical protein
VFAQQDLPTILVHAQNVLKEHYGVQQLINVFMSAGKTQPTLPLLNPVYAIQDTDYMEDHVKSAHSTILSPMDIA